MRLSVFAAIVVLGCSKRSEPPGSKGLAAQVQASATSTAPAPPPQETHLAFAIFTKGVLDECVDISVPEGRESSADRFEKAVKGMTKLQQTCAQQFKRTQLASCEIVDSDDAGRSIRFVQRFYDFGVLSKDDSEMQGCTEIGGKWSEVSRDSREWRRARLEHTQRLAGKLSAAASDEP